MASKKRWDSRMSASRKLLPRSDRGRTNSRCSGGPAMQQGREPSPTRSKFVEGEESSFVATVGCPARRDVYQAYVYTPSQAVTFGSDNPYPRNPERKRETPLQRPKLREPGIGRRGVLPEML